MQAKPFISIVTPAYRIIPYSNARIISVCEQTFDDWEWLIFDNSMDGCVKNYIDDFFNNGEGLAYPKCKEKIKCCHYPLPMVDLDDGKMGIFRNWLIRNTNCRDDGFIVTLDGDDFIFPDFLENIYLVHEQYPSCEIMTGLVQRDIFQFTDTGGFGILNTPQFEMQSQNLFNLLEVSGFENFNGWKELKEMHMQGQCPVFEKIDMRNNLKIPNTDIVFEMQQMTTLGSGRYGLFSCVKHPIVFRKDAFLKKIKKYNTVTSCEDSNDHIYPFVLNDIVFINKPSYVFVQLYDSGGRRDSGTNSVILTCNNYFNDIIMLDIYKRKYEILQDCRNYIEPIWFE